MIGEVREYRLTTTKGQHVYTVPLATEVAPGLLVYRIPDGMHPSNPNRWRIGHDTSGLAIADSLLRETAVKGAEFLGTLADWTRDSETVKAGLKFGEVMAKLSKFNCVVPNSEFMPGDVSRNGIYADADIEEAAREAQASGFNAADILVAMSATVPWMGLDTNDFNEAHDRIVRVAGAE